MRQLRRRNSYVQKSQLQGVVVRDASHGRRVRQLTDMAGASERNGSRESANAATNNGDRELLEAQW